MERGVLIAGRYELTELLGRGGMGEVWAGRDRELHRSVAVKLLHRDDNDPPELVQRFEREAVAAAQINHPNIVALYDRGTHGHLQFLVMEHVEGTSLAQYLHRQGPLNLDRALEIAQEICAALVAAHAANVVHYDIKPSNVMLTANGSIKVVDFGIAGFTHTHTHTFTVAPTTALSPVGTAQYGAPEQFLDRRGDERSDLYALGSVLFALLTGEPPFADGTPLSVIRRKLDEEPRQVAELRPDVPAPVAQLLTDLLRRDPEDRPRTATSVRQRLTRLRTVSADRDTGEAETEPVPPPAATRSLATSRAEAEDAARGANAEPPKSPAPARRWAAHTSLQLFAGVLVALALTGAAFAYFSTNRNRNTASPQPSVSATPAARYLRLPDFCGYVQNNDMRGRAELRPGSNEAGLDGTNNSKHANCGWGSADSVKENRFRVVITATLYGNVAAAKDAMAGIKLGRTTIDVALTTSKVDDTEEIPEEAKKTVQDEDLTNGDRYNSTSVYFRRNNVVVEVWYTESKVQMNDTTNKDKVTGRALTWGRSLDNFLRDEPENHEKPIWG